MIDAAVDGVEKHTSGSIIWCHSVLFCLYIHSSFAESAPGFSLECFVYIASANSYMHIVRLTYTL